MSREREQLSAWFERCVRREAQASGASRNIAAAAVAADPTMATAYAAWKAAPPPAAGNTSASAAPVGGSRRRATGGLRPASPAASPKPPASSPRLSPLDNLTRQWAAWGLPEVAARRQAGRDAFEGVVAELQAGGLSRGRAIPIAAGRAPALHRLWLQADNEARLAGGDKLAAPDRVYLAKTITGAEKALGRGPAAAKAMHALFAKKAGELEASGVSAVQARLSIGRRWPKLYAAWRAWERVREQHARIDAAGERSRGRLSAGPAGDTSPDPSPRRPAA